MWNEWNRWWSGRGTPGERPPEESVRPTSQLENNPETATESHAVELKIDPNALPDATGTKFEYNGGCERAYRALKELTSHVADQAGRRDFWQSENLLVARLRAARAGLRAWR